MEPITMATFGKVLGNLFGGGGSGGMLGRIGGALFGGGNRAVKRIGQGYDEARGLLESGLQREIGRFDPYAQIGEESTGLIRSLLGMGGTPGRADYGAYLAANPDVAAYYKNNPKALQKFGGDLDKAAQFHYETYGRNEGRQLPTTGGVSDTAGGEALARFREGMGYQDRLSAALGGATSNAAARGLLGSSGTGKVFQRTATDLANQSFGDFLGNLMGQQRVGQSAAGSQAEIGTGLASGLGKLALGKAETMAQKKGGGFLGKLFG